MGRRHKRRKRVRINIREIFLKVILAAIIGRGIDQIEGWIKQALSRDRVKIEVVIIPTKAKPERLKRSLRDLEDIE